MNFDVTATRSGVNLAASWREGVEGWAVRRDEWAEVMDDIQRLSPDVIVTTSHGWARTLNAVIGTIPIVVSALSPIEQEVISSLARASGNITGIAIDLGPDFYSKQLDLLLEAAPKVSHVAFLGAERAYHGMRQLWRDASSAASASRNFSIRITMKLSSVPWSGTGQRQFSSSRMPTMSLTPIGLHDWRDSIGCLS